ncbi:DUF4236 domain-containing protein [Rhodococcus sp. TAF43]|uniref:DUF4236 domain-containing protein n=1 Tax=Rhodococcus sp. TAF43 TaxID=3237483 RepID=UPI003F9E7E2F
MVQFRKSKKFGPVRLSASKRGLGVSVGAGPFRVSRGADGKVRRTVRVPGTGIYDTKVIGGSINKQKVTDPKVAKPAPPRKEYSSTTNGLCSIALALMIGIPSINAGFVIGIVVAAFFLLGGVALLFGKSDSGQPSKPRLPTSPGWYPDPYRAGRDRYWTGSEWSSRTR